ncbi:interference hedgehog-like isoform X2 [Phymastichus coffea]|uniref:interference hedgehog-like isoform X2 n=1 Tax=Phymastichus coffea TaxID=108790 RepID=UPI00273BFA65|nr:interference hedgehog-like isoform X2 [Phymastichus coffea]
MSTVSTLCCGFATAVLLCALGCCASGQKSEPGMVFTRHPQPFTAPLGDEVIFECSLNLAAEKFAWKHKPLGSNDWILLESNASGGKTSKIVVDFDNESKAGDYRCVAFYGTSGLASDSARLTQARLEKFMDKGNVYLRVAAGNNVPITCPVPASVPEAVIQFFKDGSPIQNASLTGSKIMLIERAKSSDSGSYHCQVNNYITSETYTSNYKTVLMVEKNASDQTPYFIRQPQHEYKVQRGKNVTLECFGVGYPIPQVMWSKLGSTLPVRSTYSPTGLNLFNVQPADRGEYDCIWTNRAGSVKSVIILTVVEPPMVLRAPKLSTFPEGGELELSCNATGYPAPHIEWLINGETLKPNRYLEIKGSTLYISLVEKKHAGLVQCVASNEYGSHSGYNYLKVHPKQHMNGSFKGRNDYGGPVNGHKHTRVGGRRRGKNGKRKNDVMVPPNQPNVTRLSDVSVMVRWSVPENHGLPILFFKVQYRELGQKPNSKPAKWMTANSDIPSHVRSFEVTDLQPEHTYRFRIAAVYSNNDNAMGPMSSRFHLTRQGDLNTNPLPIPLLTHTEALNQNQVILLWLNTNTSADIDGFYVYHRLSTSAGDYVKTTVEGKDANNITISHLQPDTTYEFKVQSFSVTAASEFSQIVRAKTKKAVTEPPIPQVMAENKVDPVESVSDSNVYAIIGGVLGGAILLIGLTAIGVAYKRRKHKTSRETSQDQGKPITNGRVMNGGITDSKINITSNPLAGLESTEDPMQPKSGQQSPMEMASFRNGQNNNGAGPPQLNHNTSHPPTTTPTSNQSTPEPPPPPILQPIDQPV